MVLVLSQSLMVQSWSSKFLMCSRTGPGLVQTGLFTHLTLLPGQLCTTIDLADVQQLEVP